MAKKDKWIWEEDTEPMRFWWEPFEPIKNFQRDLQKQFSRFFQPTIISFPVDLAETDTEIIIKADLPGFRKDEIDVEATEDRVLISARRKREKIQKGENFYRRERSAGEVRRVLSLPAKTKPDKAKLDFSDGVLTIRLPKKEEAKKKKYKLL